LKKPTRYRLLACEVLAREVYLSAAHSPNIVDVELVEKGLHNRPETLHRELQERVDSTKPNIYSAILFGYGLCGNALLGIKARDIPLVVPRAHDCITLYMGSRELYNQNFSQHPGTYYYTADYVERTSSDPEGLSISLGTAVTTDIEGTYETYVKKYGKDNADYLMEVMGAWSEHYSRAGFIDHEETAFLGYEQVAREEATRRGWKFERIPGSLVLFRELMAGGWKPGDFLVLQPGEELQASYDEQVFRACQAGE
jgi:hypothetical protein